MGSKDGDGVRLVQRQTAAVGVVVLQQRQGILTDLADELGVVCTDAAVFGG
jgi:hypothetical protein